MSFDHILERVDEFFTEKLRQFGPNHRGVDWKSPQTQELSFEQLLKIVPDRSKEFSLIDYGCGYGAMADYLNHLGAPVRFTGYDISSAMVEKATELFGSDRHVFTCAETELRPADYVVASGIFNMKQEISNDDWRSYMEETVEKFDRLSTKGFAFNVLTLYSDEDRRRGDLYYADPLYWFDRCKRKYARHVALLHDYPLWEFSILVRKEV